MSTATAVEPKSKIIQCNTLLEELYTYYSLPQLQTMLESEPEKKLLQDWRVTSKALREELKVAIDFIKKD